MSKKSNPKVKAFRKENGKVVAILSNDTEKVFINPKTPVLENTVLDAKDIKIIEIKLSKLVQQAGLSKAQQIKVKKSLTEDAKTAKFELSKVTFDHEKQAYQAALDGANSQALNTAKQSFTDLGVHVSIPCSDLRFKAVAYALHMPKMTKTEVCETLGTSTDKMNVYVPGLLAVTDIMQAVNAFVAEKKIDVKIGLNDLKKYFLTPSPSDYKYKESK